MSEFSSLLKYKRNKSNHANEIDGALNYINNPNIKCLDPTKQSSLTVPIDEFWNILRELKGFDFNIYKTSVKINFKIQGFKRVRNVVI